MSDILKGELQDNQANTIYPHTEADVVFCADGETAQSKLTKYEDALGNVTGVTDSLEVDDSKVLVSSKALHKVNSSFAYDENGIYGYRRKVDGADTVFPFKNGEFQINIINNYYRTNTNMFSLDTRNINTLSIKNVTTANNAVIRVYKTNSLINDESQSGTVIGNVSNKSSVEIDVSNADYILLFSSGGPTYTTAQIIGI